MRIEGRIGRCALALAGVCVMAMPVPLVAQGLAPEAAELTQDQALALENALAALNFDPGEVDGEIDEKTRAAVRLYQNFAALQPDGVMTPDLVAEILAVSASFTEMRSSRSDEPAPSTPEPTEPAPELVSPEPAPSDADPADVAEADSGATDTAQAAPTAVTPAPSEAVQAESVQAEPVQATLAEPDPSVATALPDPPVQAPDEVAAPAEPKASEPPPTASEPAPQAVSDEPPAAPKPEVAAPAPTPKAKPAPKLATAPDAKLPEADTAGGFDIGGVISRLAKPAAPAKAPAGASNISAQDGQIARAPAAATQTARKTGRSDDGYAAFRDAFEAAKNGDYEQAVKRYSDAIESKKLTLEHLGDAHFNRGNVLHFLRRYDDSIADYNAAIGSQPTFAGAFYNRGFAYQAKGQKQPAIKDFRQARDLGLQRLGVRAPDRPPPLQQ